MTTDTQAAIAAALMQAADKPKVHADYWRKRMGQLCDEYGRDSQEYADAGLIVARADIIRDEILALIHTDAMAALEAVKAAARREGMNEALFIAHTLCGMAGQVALAKVVETAVEEAMEGGKQ